MKVLDTLRRVRQEYGFVGYSVSLSRAKDLGFFGHLNPDLNADLIPSCNVVLANFFQSKNEKGTPKILLY